MIKKLVVIIALLLTGILPACEKSNQLCGGNNPGKDLLWLKLEIERLSPLAGCNSISRSTYKERTVFIFSNCDPNVNSIPFLFDCNGNKLNLSITDYLELNFTGPIELIWKSK